MNRAVRNTPTASAIDNASTATDTATPRHLANCRPPGGIRMITTAPTSGSSHRTESHGA